MPTHQPPRRMYTAPVMHQICSQEGSTWPLRFSKTPNSLHHPNPHTNHHLRTNSTYQNLHNNNHSHHKINTTNTPNIPPNSPTQNNHMPNPKLHQKYLSTTVTHRNHILMTPTCG
ncbi:hypothetical protein M758_8G066100 [Ceratodon purpureus]|nr:hypothetical protein M758_8G066100 [Ceratodon purpureus]